MEFLVPTVSVFLCTLLCSFSPLTRLESLPTMFPWLSAISSIVLPLAKFPEPKGSRSTILNVHTRSPATSEAISVPRATISLAADRGSGNEIASEVVNVSQGDQWSLF